MYVEQKLPTSSVADRNNLEYSNIFFAGWRPFGTQVYSPDFRGAWSHNLKYYVLFLQNNC